MSIYRDRIREILYEQTRLIELYKQELSESVDGGLICSTTKGNKYYFRSYSDNGRNVRESLSKDTDMMKKLARKEFLRRSIKALQNNIGLLERAEAHYTDEQLDELKKHMHKAYQDLPGGYFLESDMSDAGIYRQGDEHALMRHTEWANAPYRKSDYNPQGLRFPTSKGLYVRSKSEQHIAEQLYKYGVPFRYEQVLELDGLLYSADFTFEDYAGRWFFWEHAGMMNVRQYAERHNRKMRLFEDHGIVPWDNLIVTYDTDGVINLPLINSIIEHVVIPKL